MNAADAELVGSRFDMDAAAEGDLRAGACGRGNRDVGRDVGGNFRRVFEKIDDRHRMGRRDAECLARIEHRAAAEPDDAVAVPFPVYCQRRLDTGDGRIGRDAVEDRRGCAVRKCRQNRSDHPVIRKACVGDDQRPFDAAGGKFAGQGLCGAEVEGDGREAGKGGHGRAFSGNIVRLAHGSCRNLTGQCCPQTAYRQVLAVVAADFLRREISLIPTRPTRRTGKDAGAGMSAVFSTVSSTMLSIAPELVNTNSIP